MKINLLLTFDHELPLGNLRGSYDEALFAPTHKLLELAKKLDVPVTLFTDILSAVQFRNWDYEGFYLPYKEQLKKALLDGHEIQLHIHPHWLTTTFEHGKYYPSADFGLSCFQNHAVYSVENIIGTACKNLLDICREAIPDYNITAYRAGGYNIEPASSDIFKGLLRNGIKYDSSIPLGYYYASAISEIDFRKLPSLPNWYIADNGNFRKAAHDGIMEIPIATKPKSVFEIPTLFKLKKFAYRAPVSYGSMIHEGRNPSFSQKLKMYSSPRLLSFDNYTQDADYLMRILDYNVRKFKDQEELSLATCSHPKTMGTYALQMMEEFVEKARIKYPELRFVKFNQLNDRII